MLAVGVPQRASTVANFNQQLLLAVREPWKGGRLGERMRRSCP
jgi:hypothetical protein